MSNRWLTRCAFTAHFNYGFTIGLVLVLIGTDLEDHDIEWSFIPGGIGVIIWIVTLAAWIADRLDERRAHDHSL